MKSTTVRLRILLLAALSLGLLSALGILLAGATLAASRAAPPAEPAALTADAGALHAAGATLERSRAARPPQATITETVSAMRQAIAERRKAGVRPSPDFAATRGQSDDAWGRLFAGDAPRRDPRQVPLERVSREAVAASPAATVTLLTEGFETSVPPPGWAEEDVVGTTGHWAQASDTVNPAGGGVHGGSYMALFNSNSIPAGDATRLYVSGLDLSYTVGDYTVGFWMYHDDSGFNPLFDDHLQVEVNDGAGWSDLGDPLYTGETGIGWFHHTLDLSAYRGKVISLGFQGISGNILDVAIDDIEVYYEPAPLLTVTKTPDRVAVAPGAELTYTVAITRGGLTSGANVALTDTLDAYQRPVSVAASQGICAISDPGWGGGVTCALGAIPIGATALVTLTAQASASLPITPLQQITDTAQVTADDAAASAQAAVYIDTCRVRLVEGANVYPHATVQAAIDAASTPTSEVQVAGACFGVEAGSGVRQLAYIDKTLTLRGGYKPDFTAWDPDLYPTYLHAAGLGRVIHLDGAITPLIEGLRIMGGNAAGLDNDLGLLINAGGGIFGIDASPTIRGNIIAGNDTGSAAFIRIGGGICLLDAWDSPRIEDNVISDNIAGPYLGGGGVAVLGSAGLVIANNTVSSNTVVLDDYEQWSYGGGIYVDSSDDVTLDGNIIRGNAACRDFSLPASGDPTETCSGGGLYVYDTWGITLTNNSIIGNSAAAQGWMGRGGGLQMDDSLDISLSQNTVQDNMACEAWSGEGGGIGLWGSESITLTNNSVRGNVAAREDSAGLGGGIYLHSAYAATLSENIVQDNVSGEEDGGDGGGIAASGEELILTGNTVVNNTAAAGDEGGIGGGILVGGEDIVVSGNTVYGNRAGLSEGKGGGISVNGVSNVVLEGNTVQDNVAATHLQGAGGGVYATGNVSLRSNTIVSNTTGTGSPLTGADCGGGVYGLDGDFMLDGNVIRYNATGENIHGGGVCFEDSDAGLRNNVIADNGIHASSLGAGLYAAHSALIMRHDTVARNTGGDGSALYVTYKAGWGYSTAILTNPIIAGHTFGVFVDAGSTATVDGVLWHANTANTGGAGTINVTNALAGDPVFAGDGYHITPASAGLDNGVEGGVNDDIDDDFRPAGFGFDRGADELPGVGFALVKQASADTVSAGATITYAIVLTSSGTAPATAVGLTDTLPAEQQIATYATDRGTCNTVAGWGGDLTCALGDMPVGATAHLTLTSQVTTAIPTVLPLTMRNIVTATAAEAARSTHADTLLTACRAKVKGVEYADVQAAVDAASAGDVVQVAGVCLGVNTRGGLRQHVYVSKSLTLEGGWKNDFTVRDPSLYPTTLDAQGQGRVIYIANSTVVTVTGLTLRHGSAAGLAGFQDGGNTYDAGGGLYALNTRVIVSGCVIAENSVNEPDYFGAGVFLNNGDGSTFLDNVIRDNRNTSDDVDNRGGGLFAATSDNLFLQGNQFLRNQAVFGGGLEVYRSRFTLDDNLVQDNVAVAFTGLGCGLYTYSTGVATLSGNQFLDNTGCTDGGGAYLSGAPGSVIRENLFQGNSGNNGGGLRLENCSNTRVDDNQFLGNTGGEDGAGGGLYIGPGAGYTLQRNLIIGNTAGEGGGGFYLRASAALTNNVISDNALTKDYRNGAGLTIYDADVTLRHTTLARNTVNYGNGFYVGGTGRTVTLDNAIVAGHTTGIAANAGNTVVVNGVLWHDNTADTGGGGAFNVTSPYTGDPAFAADGYHITAASAALDRGGFVGVSNDVDGDARPTNPARPDAPDLGADENRDLTVTRPVTATVSFGAACARLVFTDTGGLSAITLTVAPGRFPTNIPTDQVVSRTVVITPSAGTAVSATLALCYEDGELRSGLSESNLRLYRWTGSGWAGYPTTVDIINNVVTATGVTAFSPWVIGTAGATPTAARVARLSARSAPPFPALAGSLVTLAAVGLAVRPWRSRRVGSSAALKGLHERSRRSHRR